MPFTAFRNMGAALAIAVLAAACASGAGGRALPLRASGPGAGPACLVSDSDLSLLLNEGFQRFSAIVTAAADRIKDETSDLSMRRRAVYWKSVAIPAYAAMISHPNPRVALLDILTYTASMRRSFETGEGRELFGRWQPLALAAAKTADEDTRAIARQALSEADLAGVLARLGAPAALDPYGTVPMSAVSDSSREIILRRGGSVPEESLSTFRLLTSRIDAATDAVRQAARVGDRIARVAELSPNTGRWSAELLVYDLLQTKELSDTVGSLRTLADSTAALTRMGQDLPERIQVMSDSVFAQVRERETRILAILSETRGAIAEASRTLSVASRASSDFAAGVDGLAKASVQWNSTIAAASLLNRDYNETTRSLMLSSAEMRKVVDETRKVIVETRMLMDPAAFARMSAQAQALSRSMSAQADDLSRRVMNRFFWRIFFLIVTFFAALFAYRLAAFRLMGSKGRAGAKDLES